MGDSPPAAVEASLYKLSYKIKPRTEQMPDRLAKQVDAKGWAPMFRMLVLTEAQAKYLRGNQDPNLSVVIAQLIAPIEFKIADVKLEKVASAGLVGADA